MDKSPEAFRTISEVAEALETPAHVLRFWESRFPQIRPVKRAGGRRYYRPSDVALLTGIKRLLHEEGLTIRGVQKILREQGVRHVSGQGEEPSAEEIALEAAMAVEVEEVDSPPAPEPTPEEAAEATAAALAAALGTPPEEESQAAPEALTAEEPEPAPLPEPALLSRAEAEPPSVPEPETAPWREPAAAAAPTPVQAELFPAPPSPQPVQATTPEPAAAPRDDAPRATSAARLRALPKGSLDARGARLMTCWSGCATCARGCPRRLRGHDPGARGPGPCPRFPACPRPENRYEDARVGP